MNQIPGLLVFQPQLLLVSLTFEIYIICFPAFYHQISDFLLCRNQKSEIQKNNALFPDYLISHFKKSDFTHFEHLF